MIFDAHPTAEKELHETNKYYLQIACTHSRGETIGVMVWNTFIVLVCCTFAFLTRKLPENYNETKFITFCSFCSLVVLLAFSSTYFTVGDVYSRLGESSLGLMVNATVTLVCLYAIKIYAIYFAKSEDIHVKLPVRSHCDSNCSNNKALKSSDTEQNEDKKQPSGIAPASIGIQQEESMGSASSFCQMASTHQETIHERNNGTRSNPKIIRGRSTTKPVIPPKPDLVGRSVKTGQATNKSNE